MLTRVRTTQGPVLLSSDDIDTIWSYHTYTLALPRIFRLFEYSKKSLLKSSHQKNTFQIFLPEKIPESKISNPKIILWSSPSLEIRSIPLDTRQKPYPAGVLTKYRLSNSAVGFFGQVLAYILAAGITADPVWFMLREICFPFSFMAK